MTNITCKIDNGDVTLQLMGHANSGPPGQDLVCCAISTIITTTMLGLEQLSNQYPEHIKFDLIDKNEKE